MANIKQIKLPNDTTYDIADAHKSGIYTVIGTQTAATGSWTGALHGVSALYDGLTIMYYLPWAGSGNATLNLTLDDSTTTGAVDCYYATNTRLTTHYAKGSNIVMTYWSAGSISIDGTATTNNRWIANANYDTNDIAFHVRRMYSSLKAGANKIFPYTIIMENNDNRWESIVTSASTATTKTRNTHGFRLGQVLINYANTTYDENVEIANNNIWDAYTNVADMRYSFNVANNTTYGMTAKQPVYLVGSLASDGLFYLDTTWWTQTLPSTEDGKLYIHIGEAYDRYRIDFIIHNPIYHYSNGAVREFIQDSGTVNGHTVGIDVPSDAVFTDHTYSGTGLISVNSSGVISTTAEVNQNAFSNVKVGSTTVAADSKTDTLELVGGSNVTLTPDATNDKVTIAATNTTYTISKGDGAGQIKVTPSSGDEYNVDVKGMEEGYLNIHPENNPVLIPFMNNDIAYLTKKGGSAIIKYDGVEQPSVSLNNIFDASPSYLSIDSRDKSEVVIEMTLHKAFNWSNIVYIDFGNVSWRAKSIKFEVMNSNYEGDTWTQKFSTTTNAQGHCRANVSHQPVGASNTGAGFNKLRVTLADWQSSAASGLRIAQVGIYNYGSYGLRETFLPKDGGEMYNATVNPATNDTGSIGTSAKKWANGYFTNINGVAVGNSPKFTDTTYTVAQGDSNGQIKVTPSSGSAYNVSVKGLNNSAYKDFTTSVTSGSADLVTSGAVYTAIDNLPEPMVFKGTLGTGGTITSLPTASASNEGYTYKVITAGTYASQSAKVGDVFVSNGSEWVIIPSGDTDSDTWRNIKVNGTEKLGNAISTGAVDFVNGTGTTVSFNATGSQVSYSVTYGSAANTACQGNDSRLSDARTPTSHTHGNIQNGGTLQTNDVAIASGDKLVVTDSSDSNKVARASVSFDGSTTNTALTPKGTFESFAQHYGDLTPIMSKTFTNVIATSNNFAGGWFFYGKVLPTDFYAMYKIHYKITSVAAGRSDSKTVCDIWICGTQSALLAYSSFNVIANTSYYAQYNNEYYRATSAGITGGYGHLIGVRLQSAWNPTTAANSRTITVDILETENCTFTFFDNMTVYANVPGTGSTNYSAYSDLNGISQGLQETGDANTTTENRIANFSAKTGSIGIFYYGLFMEDANGTYQSICTASDGTVTNANQTTATNKLANPNGFKVGSSIWYSNTGYNANSNISGGSVVYSSISVFDTRYSFNTTRAEGSLTPYAPLYLVGTINSNDGLFHLDQVWWTQTPNATDKIYVLVGGVYDSTTSNVRATLYEQNKWFKYDGTRLVDITTTAPNVSNSTVTIQKNGTTVDSFTLNQSSDKTVNITMSASDVGLGDVPNVATNDQTPTFTQASTRANIASGEKISVLFGKIMKWFADLKDLAFIAKDGTSSTKYLRGDGTWQAFPTIPTVNDKTLTIKQNNASKGTFTANSATDVSIDLTDTTYTSEQEAESGTAVSLVTTGEKYNWNHGIETVLVHKEYNGTNVYPVSGDSDTQSWYFMSVRPDSYGESWSVKCRVLSYCANNPEQRTDTLMEISQASSDTPIEGCARNYQAASFSHYRAAPRRVTSAGYTAGYGQAIGIVLNSGNSGSENYRTIIVDIFRCENCSVTLLNTPVKWSEWTGASAENYIDYLGYLTNIGLYSDGYISSVTNKVYVYGISGSSGLMYLALLSGYTDQSVGINHCFGVNPNDGYMQIAKEHTSTTSVDSGLWCGNNIPNGTAGAVRGILNLFAANGKANYILPAENSADRIYTLPTTGVDSTLALMERTFPCYVGLSVGTLDEFVNLLSRGNGRSFSGSVKFTADVGVGISANNWTRVIMMSQNAPNNGTYDLGLFALFLPNDSSLFIQYAIVQGTTAGNYTVQKTGNIVTNIYEGALQICPAGNGQLNLGNNLAADHSKKSTGRLVLYSDTGNYYSDIKATGLTGSRHLLCPDKGGTIAVTSDIVNDKVTITHSSSNSSYPICFEAHNNTQEYTTKIYKTTKTTVNPSDGTISVNGTLYAYGAVMFNGTGGGIESATQRITLKASNESNYWVDLAVKESTPTWGFSPSSTKKLKLGSPSYLWTTVYAQTGSINTSDRNEKKDIQPLDESAKDFIMALNPVSYKFKDGESGRTHYGMIAQDVEEEMAELGMTAMDFAGFCKDQKTIPYTEEKDGKQIQKDMPVEGQYTYGLRYEEFMAPAIKTIQLLQKQVDAQQQEIDELKNELAEIKAMLNGGN